ncbi:MAG: hypothetical protein ACRD3C_11215 [Vicinamibacterales bacterium]
MTRLITVVGLVLSTSVAYTQEPVKSPSQQETLAKWPWSISLQTAPFKQETVTFTLGPKEGMEYKYRLEKGSSMLYAWTASSELYWELHSEPDGAPRGYAEFFDTSGGDRSNGVYNAPFSGIHGWWWENKSDRNVTITLSSAGFYSESREFRKGQPVRIAPIK